MGGRLDPVTAKILSWWPSEAQIRALRLASEEGSLVPYGDVTKLRWAQPSRRGAEEKPYEEGRTVFSLERRGLLRADPKAERGPIPRPRLITDLGRRYLRVLDEK